jgi:hypothetical protein
MLTLHELQSVLDLVEYKPGWKMDIYETATQGIFWRLQVSMEDSYNPGEFVDLSIESALPMPLMQSEYHFKEWLRWRLEGIEVHECHEWLRWKSTGKPLFDPHQEGATKPRKS